jgi:putative FmdB family regulatory protein
MPLYAYDCQRCGAEAEYIQKFSDPPVKKCERCGGRLRKRLTAAAFHLKGSGWYRDGYASARPGTESGAGGETPATGDAAASAPPAEVTGTKATAGDGKKPAKKKGKREAAA